MVTSYGSAAGELAACVSAVGLADCSQMTKLVVSGPAGRLRELTRCLADAELALGGLVHEAGAWWCAESCERLLVLAEPGADPLARRPELAAPDRSPVAVSDRSLDWAALAVVGQRAGAVLAALGVYDPSGEPRAAAPVAARTAAGVTATWVLQADDRALAVLPRADAPALWQAIAAIGRPWGICAVGQQAIARYALMRPPGAF